MKNTKKIEFKPLTQIDGNRSEAVNVRRRGDWMEVTGTPAAVCPKTTDDRFSAPTVAAAAHTTSCSATEKT